MIAQSDKEVEEELRASSMHLQLHRAASLECATTTDDQGKVVCPKFRITVRSVGICIAGRCKNRAALYTRF